MKCAGTTAKVVITTRTNRIRGIWNIIESGSNINHSFVVEAPGGIPSHAEAYMLEGYWDNNGNIGTYSTRGKSRLPGGGNNHRYEGGALLIGSGTKINGSVIEDGEQSQLNNQAESNGLIEWRWDKENLEFDVSSNRTPITVTESRGVVKVFDKNNSLMFSRLFYQPEVEVICGEECPNGYLKCSKSSYPGYCCIPCGEIKSGIVEATNLIKRLNRG